MKVKKEEVDEEEEEERYVRQSYNFDGREEVFLSKLIRNFSVGF